jgi:hypothetical protein
MCGLHDICVVFACLPQVLEEAIATAARWGLVMAHQHVVVMERIHEDYAVKVRLHSTRANILVAVLWVFNSMMCQDSATSLVDTFQELNNIDSSAQAPFRRGNGSPGGDPLRQDQHFQPVRLRQAFCLKPGHYRANAKPVL